MPKNLPDDVESVSFAGFTQNKLRELGITKSTVLLTYSEKDLKDAGCGKRILPDIRKTLKEYGRELRKE